MTQNADVSPAPNASPFVGGEMGLVESQICECARAAGDSERDESMKGVEMKISSSEVKVSIGAVRE